MAKCTSCPLVLDMAMWLALANTALGDWQAVSKRAWNVPVHPNTGVRPLEHNYGETSLRHVEKIWSLKPAPCEAQPRSPPSTQHAEASLAVTLQPSHRHLRGKCSGPEGFMAGFSFPPVRRPVPMGDTHVHSFQINSPPSSGRSNLCLAHSYDTQALGCFLVETTHWPVLWG